MGYGLYLALVQQKGRLNKRFSVAGGAGMDDLNPFRELTVDVLDSGDGSSQRIALVIVVEGVQQGPVLAYQGCLGGGRTCVDP